MTKALEANGLSKHFGRSWALRDCSFAVPTGRIVALVGPNGAGKTTLMLHAMGLLRPSSGEVRVFGWSPQQHSLLVLSRVGFVAQNRPLYQGFTVQRMLRFGSKLNPRWDDEFARARLESLQIPPSQRIGKLSGGQQAQVVLTMALAKRPELLLLDEPAANLDPVARHAFAKAILDAAAQDGLTVIFSSHVVAELEQFCDYLVVLNGGRVQLAGELDQLLEEHHVLTGDPAAANRVANHPGVVHITPGPRQATVVVRKDSAVAGAGWERHPIGLQELVLAYMQSPTATALPRPELAEQAS
jgi:ABC-2 type transport system ATP-binding protein